MPIAEAEMQNRQEMTLKMSDNTPQQEPIISDKHLTENTSFLSPCNALLRERLLSNPLAAKETVKKVKAQATEGAVNVHYEVVPWPLVVSQDRISDFKQMVKALSSIVIKVIKNYFGSDVQAFCDYFDSSPDIYEMLMASTIQPSQVVCRHDVLYSNNELKLLEINMGTNIGGWEMDWLHGDTLKAVAGVGALSGKQVAYHPVIPTMLDALAKSVNALDKPGKTGNVLFRLAPMSEIGMIKTALLIQSYYQASKHYQSGKVYAFCDMEDVQFKDTNRVYFEGHEMDAVMLLDSTMPETLSNKLDEAYIAKNILYPDSSVHQLIGSKTLMALLHEDRAKELMGEHHAAWIDKHLPWTVRSNRQTVRWQSTEQNLSELLLQSKENFVLKQAHSFQGKDVHIGKHTEIDEWTALVEKVTTQANWIVQEFCPSDPIYCANTQSQSQAIIPVLAAFGFGESYGGSFARGLPMDIDRGVVNLSQGAEVFVFLEDKTRP